jgi:hypothetical protein
VPSPTERDKMEAVPKVAILDVGVTPWLDRVSLGRAGGTSPLAVGNFGGDGTFGVYVR